MLCEIVAAALSEDRATLQPSRISDAQHVLVKGLADLGVDISIDEDFGVVNVAGCRGYPPDTDAIVTVEGDTDALPLLLAVAATGLGTRLVRAPFGAGVSAIPTVSSGLRDLGCGLTCEEVVDGVEYSIAASGLRGGRLYFSGSRRGLELAALLLAAPLCRADVQIELSKPLDRTEPVIEAESAMKNRGVELIRNGFQRFIIPAPQFYGRPA
jgi:3-phosphoshikimate 1-carboxyvinyltransferase